MPTRLDLSQAYPNHQGSPLAVEAEWPADVAGYRTLYRIGFQSMQLAGLPELLSVDGVYVLQTMGPVLTRKVDIVQRPEAKLVWDKTDYPEIWVGRGLPLTVAHVATVLPTGTVEAEFAQGRDRIYSAAGVIAALLDERVSQHELFDDFLIFTGDQLTHVADSRLLVRNFLPFEVGESDLQALLSLATLEPSSRARIAAR